MIKAKETMMKKTNGFYPKHIMNKVAKMRATPLTDTLGALAGGMLPFGEITSPIGSMYGALDRDRYEHQDVGGAFIPGVGAARLINRLKSQVGKEVRDTEDDPKNKDARPVRHAISEQLSPLTSMLVTTGLGAGLGKLIGRSNKGAIRGAQIGAIAGGSGLLAGSILAALKRRRTAQEQIDNDKKTVLKDLLIPGVGQYNKHKRMGRSQGDRDELEAAKKGKSEKKAYQLNKTAGLGSLLTKPFRALSRYFELLAGGDVRKLESYNKILERVKSNSNLLETIKFNAKHGTGQVFSHGGQSFTASPEVAEELEKIINTRRNSLIGLGMAGAYGYGVSESKKKKGWFD